MKWTLVKNKLPENDSLAYMVYGPYVGISLAVIYHNKWRTWNPCGDKEEIEEINEPWVTHWMELPEHPIAELSYEEKVNKIKELFDFFPEEDIQSTSSSYEFYERVKKVILS